MTYSKLTMVYLFSLTFLTSLSGCATANLKKDIGADLAKIISYQDCPTICDALKAYAKSKLGVEVAE